MSSLWNWSTWKQFDRYNLEFGTLLVRDHFKRSGQPLPPEIEAALSQINQGWERLFKALPPSSKVASPGQSSSSRRKVRRG